MGCGGGRLGLVSVTLGDVTSLVILLSMVHGIHVDHRRSAADRWSEVNKTAALEFSSLTDNPDGHSPFLVLIYGCSVPIVRACNCLAAALVCISYNGDAERKPQAAMFLWASVASAEPVTQPDLQ